MLLKEVIIVQIITELGKLKLDMYQMYMLIETGVIISKHLQKKLPDSFGSGK
ncbi:hypothetical protein KTC92_14520 [Clostridium sp. CM027]|uniref:hypothetical protein n=1 Tax=Clostridium sp. CM027 TaxID=2849865 RepID=UPI001C6DEB3B|nr:hypothetical protein [Clostridium sp. CM027]MBW9145193.1 hypothetical protein [Clostridium sp. CM027]UVE40326.1 hypothetical protein KTC92_14520 [Clostridium sp. CM027]